MHLPGFDIYLNHSTCEGSANSSEMDGSVPPNSGSSNPSAILLPICAALMIAANYVPLLLLLKVKKLAACTLVIVVAIENVFTFINAILWPNDNTAEWYSGAGLCDVQVAIRTPLTTLLASSTAYLSWDLAKALDTNNPRLYETRKSRRRRIAIELLFCFAVPALQVPLQYVILMNRFSIATIYGCSGYWDNSWPSLVILAIWPPIFALVNCCFAGRFHSMDLMISF
jgi:pheromone a factor receptor